MTRSEDEPLQHLDESEVAAPRRTDPHPSEIIPGVFGRRLGLEGVPRRDEEAAGRPGSDPLETEP